MHFPRFIAILTFFFFLHSGDAFALSVHMHALHAGSLQSEKAESERIQRRNELLSKNYFGDEVVAVWGALLYDQELVTLFREVIVSEYYRCLGDEAGDLVSHFFAGLITLADKVEDGEVVTEDAILRLMKDMRSQFENSAAQKVYSGTYREGQLARSVEYAGREHFSGVFVDVGCGDNKLGDVLYDRENGNVTKVVGVDIKKPESLTDNGYSSFVLMEAGASRSIPVGTNTADTVVFRYSLHHMPKAQQDHMLREMFRILKPGGTGIIYENTYSFSREPLIINRLHERLKELEEPDRVRLLLTVLDSVSFVIKDKVQPFPLTYYTVEKWEETFERHGFDICETRYFGWPEEGGMHQAPLGVFLLTKQHEQDAYVRTLDEAYARNHEEELLDLQRRVFPQGKGYFFDDANFSEITNGDRWKDSLVMVGENDMPLAMLIGHTLVAYPIKRDPTTGRNTPLGIAEESYFIRSLAVHENWEGRGLAKRLMYEFALRARTREIREGGNDNPLISAYTNIHNKGTRGAEGRLGVNEAMGLKKGITFPYKGSHEVVYTGRAVKVIDAGKKFEQKKARVNEEKRAQDIIQAA